MTIDFIRDVILGNDIVGIMDQGSDVYLFSFKYSYRKDLNIVIRLKGEMAYIVTAFPQDAEKRVKHEKTKKEKG